MTDDDLIERIAEAIAETHVKHLGQWVGETPEFFSHFRESFLEEARAALDVARPAIRNETLDEVADELQSRQYGMGLYFTNDPGLKLNAHDFVRSLRSDSKGDSND